MTRILLIRHAVTDAVGKYLSGRKAGVHLNAKGKEQAQDLMERLRGVALSAVYSSPLERAVQTAEPLAKVLHLPVVQNDHFLELDFGEWTGKSIDALANNEAFQQFNSFRSLAPVPGGESMLQAQVRIIGGLQDLCAKHQGQTVAVVSHADLIKAAIAYYTGMPLDLFQRIEISPASVSVVDVYKETVRILLVNGVGSVNY